MMKKEMTKKIFQRRIWNEETSVHLYLLEFLLWREDGGSKVPGAVLLPEPATRRGGDASGLQKLQAVKDVGHQPLLLGGGHGARR